MKRLLLVVVIALGVVAPLVAGQGIAAAIQEYTIPVILDFSGPFAENSPIFVRVQKGIFAWWNDAVGKNMGIKLNPRVYDGRYDASVIASMWPGILAECKPIVLVGMGGADAAALQQRLPRDKVPATYGSGSYGYEWLPEQWLFHTRPTWVQEKLAAIEWFIKTYPEKKPVKLAIAVVNVPPALDFRKGLEKYFQEVLEPKGLGKVAAVEYMDITPVDISNQVKKIVDAKADLVTGIVTPAMMAAYMRACQLYGVNIPTIGAGHETVWPYARAMKTFAPFEGHLVVGCVASTTDKNSQAYQFFKTLQKSYGLKEEDWNPQNMIPFGQSIFTVRAIERAAKKVGGANLAGQAVYDAIQSGPFSHEELMGILPAISFTKEAPFPTGKLQATIETVRNGTYVLATPEWVPVPEVTKW